MTAACIAIADLVKRFGSNTVLKGVNARVQRGEVIGLLGLNGAGKTTLLETLLGFCIPDTGSATLFGHVEASRMDTPTKLRIGFVPQRDELVDAMTGKQYLALMAGFYPHWNHALIGRLTQEWSVPMGERCSSLSVGQRQKLSILAALGHEPELLVLDEPVASLDPLARRLFLRELVQLSADSDRTVLFSTHIVSDLERIASRVWLIKDGNIAIDDSLDGFKERYVRVHLPPGASVPVALPGLLRRRQEQQTEVLLFDGWDASRAAALAAACPDGWEAEPLALEEIFVELHT
jgi:ABC-2 type transport system ATP-binding protein